LNRALRTLLISATFAQGTAVMAKSAIDTQVAVGYGVGAKFAGGDEDIPASFVPLSIAIVYEDNFWDLNKYTAGIVFQHGLVSYAEQASSYEGQNVLAGVRLGFNLLETKKSFYQISADYMPYNEMSVTSDTTAKVNGSVYNHSSLTTYTGSGATEIRFGWVTEITDGQFTKDERLRYGLYVGQISQSLTSKSTTVVTSSSTLAPTGTTDEDVTMTFSSAVVTFIGSFAF
jgi:hypothetical protein